MAKTQVVERSVIQLRGEKKRVKLIARKSTNGEGVVYDVTVGNSVEYEGIKQESDAQQLYRQAKKEATADLKSGSSGESTSSSKSVGDYAAAFTNKVNKTVKGGSKDKQSKENGSNAIQDFASSFSSKVNDTVKGAAESDEMDDDDDESGGGFGGFLTGSGDSDGGGPMLPGMQGDDMEGDGPTLPGMSGDDDGQGPMLPGFGMDDDADGGPSLPGFGPADDDEEKTGPMLPGFGGDMDGDGPMIPGAFGPMEQTEDSDDEDSDDETQTGYRFPGF
jgi:hypothetical protein